MPKGTPLIKELAQDYEALNKKIIEAGPIDARLNGLLAQREHTLDLMNQHHDKTLKLTREIVDSTEDTAEESKKVGDAVRSTFPGLVSMAESAYETYNSFKLMVPKGGAFLGIAFLIGKAFLSIQEAVTDTRKELGVSYGEAVKITAQNKILGIQAKTYGLSVDDITSAQAAIRNDLGASVQESVKLSLNFARTSAATGQTSEELATSLSLMESMSSSSRDVLLNQIRTNAAMIEAAGVAPSLVMKDLSENAEFFATFAKAGGQNLIGAGIAARKLGLNMSAVAGITESLLDFETSIEKQMEASLLLGRQINLDRARRLAFTGDQAGMMEEILRQVGGEAEFTKMAFHQRKALAESVGVNVEQLSRLVRNNTAGAPGAAIGAAAAGGGKDAYPLWESIDGGIRGLRRDFQGS
tara:strand:- start:8701 stop:9936 length:1236 start_codon:yes stop_codon:yes gene_type:complete